MDEIVMYSRQGTPADVIYKVVKMLDINVIPSINGFEIAMGLPHSDYGQTVRLWSEIPPSITRDTDLVQRGLPVVSFKGGGYFCFFLHFSSDCFLDNPPLFISNFSTALSEWEKKQDESTRCVLRAHPVSEIWVFKGSDGLFHAMVEFSMKRMNDVGLHQLEMGWG